AKAILERLDCWRVQRISFKILGKTMGLKIAVIGGGSSYTPELFADLGAAREPLDVEQVVLMDRNGARAAFVAEVSERLVRASGQKITVTGTSFLEEAISGADFIILQIRVGGL